MLRHRRSIELQSEMNLTNLLDTAFVLLIAFMLMAPMLKHGVELNLPRVQKGGGPISTQQSTVTIVIGKAVTADASAPIFIDDSERQSLDEMAEALTKRKESVEELSVVIEADRTVPWESVAQVLARVKQVGISKVGLVFQSK